MYIGCEGTRNIERFGFDEAMKKLAERGYTAVDFQFFGNTERPIWKLPEEEFVATLEHYKKVADEAGITFYQVHGPWRFPPRDFEPIDRAERVEKMIKSIRGTAILGAKYWVIHNLMPCGLVDDNPELVKQINREVMPLLAAYAKPLGVTVCMENMPFNQQCLASPHDTLEFIKSLHLDNLKMCLDTGHAAIFGRDIGDVVREIGKDYLAVLHIHDNDGTADQHKLPGRGILNWDHFTSALAEIGFDGNMSLETEVAKDLSDEEFEEQSNLYVGTIRALTRQVEEKKAALR